MTTATLTNNQAFFYIDGIPTKGLWVDLDEVEGWDTVAALLSEKYPNSDIDEILCADIEGIGRHFYASNCDSFSMNEWLEFKEGMASTHLDYEIVAAYLECFGKYGDIDISEIEDQYYGQYDDFMAFTYQFIDDTCALDGMPEDLKSYFDYEKYGNDLSYDFSISNDGHVFRSC